MPEQNNRLVKNDFQTSLTAAELRIAQYEPPASNARQGQNPTGTYQVNLQDVQRQFAEKSGQERTDALFDLLVRLITQGAADEINRQQLLQRITNLESRLTAAGIPTV